VKAGLPELCTSASTIIVFAVMIAWPNYDSAGPTSICAENADVGSIRNAAATAPSYDTSLGYRTGITEDQLKGAPKFNRNTDWDPRVAECFNSEQIFSSKVALA
jgi:cytochrome c5